jgi:hypothetical protein
MRRFIPLLCLPVLIPAAGLAAPRGRSAPPNLPPEAVVVAALDNHPTVAAAGQRVRPPAPQRRWAGVATKCW